MSTPAEHAAAIERWQRALDESERKKGPGLLASAAVFTGLDSWPDVMRAARERAHPGAIELLCRRVERAL